MNREEILSVYNAGPEAVIKLVLSMSDQTEELKERIKVLEGILGQNSSNSGKPPSTDWPTKQKSLRGKSGRSPGGQKGHKGHNLKMAEVPDSIKVHKVSTCSSCGGCLDDIMPAGYRKRQVFDLPPIKVEVTEHRAEEKLCPHCGHKNEASFPEDVSQPTQYGPRIKAVCTYLSQYQLLPYERTSELFSDLFGTSLSAATIVNANRVCFEALESVEDNIKQQIIASPVVHFDETGVYVDVSRWWLHVASTKYLTYYAVHPRRGKAATDEIDILPNFKGTAVHDCWNTYFKYDCDHGLCNVHHLRDLKGTEEFYDQNWPINMTDLLLEIKKTVDIKKLVADKLEQNKINGFKKRYDRIIKAGLGQNPIAKVRDGPKKRGRIKQSKAKNLLDRLKVHWRETLAFMYDFSIPFDNSQAERDVRMMKVQQKISGTFRSVDGAKTFCRIRGYISTVRKNSFSAIDAIQAAFEGKPFIVVPTES
ncbi:MAG: IS66 family transposase [Candidatus Humimicrobiaceae bacterium]